VGFKKRKKMLDYTYLIPLFPLLGFLTNLFLGYKIPKKLVGWVACGSVGLSFITAAGVVAELLSRPHGSRFFTQNLFEWVGSGGFMSSFGLQVDALSAVMILVVSGVGFLIHVYSVGYMSHDPGYPRYFTYLNLFTFAMLLLVLGNNFLLMFVGWEGVGLCSYLLIGFWFERKSAADAGKKAFIVNRVGDFGFLLGLMLIFTTFGTISFSEVFAAAPSKLAMGGGLATAITLLLFLGATGKSAQIPLYVWLPDAMEGPTPVSALIHAATMVTAGVYMVARCHVLYELAPISLMVVALIGAATAIFAASIGLVQNDIKRVLAYSTVSQLGYMFLACGVGAFSAAIFHLMTHAFFKALLFLGSGSVIHAISGEQDIRKMGALRKKIPITFWTFAVGCLAIAGVPGLAGFFSKDEILWQAYSSPYGHVGLWVIGAIAAGFTAFYMFRLLFVTFFGKSRVPHDVEHHIHESPPVMTLPLVLLAVGSVLAGYVGVPHILGGGNYIEEFLNEALKSPAHPAEVAAHGGAGLELGLMAASVIIALIGIGIAYAFYIKDPARPQALAEKMKGLYTTLLNKYYVDELYDYLIVNPIKRGSIWLWEFFDTKVIDGSVNGTALIIDWGSGLLRKYQTGIVLNYILSFLAGAVIIIGYLLLR
jgi:NADH-quinone oxidoreductase subunit L